MQARVVQRIEEDAPTTETRMKTFARTLVAAAILSFAVTASAQSQAPGPGSPGAGTQGATGPTRRSPPTPPPEAVAACAGKAVGAACTFQHKDRTETGTCFTPDPAQAIACKPVRPPREDASGTGR